MTLTNKSQILGVQSTNDASKVKVAYNDGGEIKEYQEPFNSFNHPTPKIR